MKKLLSLIVAIALLAFLVACAAPGASNPEAATPVAAEATPPTATEEAAPADTSGYPLTIKHAFGETVLPKSRSGLQPSPGGTRMCRWRSASSP